MRAAVLLRNVVGEAEHRFLVRIGPLQGDVDHDAILLADGGDDLAVQRRLQLRQMLHEAGDAAFVLEQVALAFAALIDQLDAYAGIEEAQLAQALGQDVVMEFDVGEDFGAGQEAQRGAALVGIGRLLQRVLRFAERVFLLEVAAVAPDIEPERGRQRVHHRHTDAVQAAGDLVAVVVEFAAGVQHGQDHFGRGNAFFLVDVDRNAAAVVGHRTRAVVVQGDGDGVAMAGQGFVDGVIDYLEHHVVQAGAVMDVADVHAGPLAHGFQATEDGNPAGIVGRFRCCALLFGHTLFGFPVVSINH